MSIRPQSRYVADISGKKFGELTAISTSSSYRGDQIWKCTCVCSMEVKVFRKTLDRHEYHSCLGPGRSCPVNRRLPKIPSRLTHGHTGSPTHNSWLAMKSRCNNPNHNRYKSYGGRGIKVCDRWLNSFENFLEDMGERPPGMTIDRKNVDRDYCPENCRWATTKTQGRNRSDSRLLSYNGEEKTLSEWAEALNTSAGAISNRLNSGWSTEKALGTPVAKSSKRASPIWGRNRKNNVYLDYNGERRMLVDWADVTGIPKRVIRERLALGWSIERTLETPVRKHKPRH